MTRRLARFSSGGREVSCINSLGRAHLVLPCHIGSEVWTLYKDEVIKGGVVISARELMGQSYLLECPY